MYHFLNNITCAHGILLCMVTFRDDGADEQRYPQVVFDLLTQPRRV